MESLHNHYYGITKKMLSFVGQWPYQKRRAKILRLTLVTAYIISMIIPQICKFFHCNGDVQCILTTTPSYLFTNMIMVKLYTCQFKSNNIKDLTGYLIDDWKHLETWEEYEIMKSYGENGRRISLMYSSYCIITTILFVCATLVPLLLDIVLPLNETRPILMPHETYYFVDEREYFFYIFFHTFIGIEVGIIGLLAHDCMLLSYIEHVCSIFAVTGFRLKNVAHDKNINATNSNLDSTYNKKIASSISAHWRALQFAELLEETFSLSFAIQLGMVTIGMSITLLQVAIQMDEIMEAARYLAFVISQLINIFCFSLQGQKLIDHSLRMCDKIYNCSWYEIPVKSQKSLLLIMRRSLQPNFLSAGKIYIFSLKNFTTVIQTSVSYFTVLASFQ